MSSDKIKCPHCAEEIRSDAKKCKHCGEWLGQGKPLPPAPTKKKGLSFCAGAVITTVVLIVLAIIVASIGGSSSVTNNSASTTSKVKQYRLGEDARVGNIRWKLVSAVDKGTVLKAKDSRYASIAKDKTASGKFVEITVEVENLGEDMKSVTNLNLKDSKGREFVHSTDTSEWIPEGKDLFLLSNLNPNVPSTFTDLYEVPADALGLVVTVGDLELFKDNKAEISLGF